MFLCCLCACTVPLNLHSKCMDSQDSLTCSCTFVFLYCRWSTLIMAACISSNHEWWISYQSLFAKLSRGWTECVLSLSFIVCLSVCLSMLCWIICKRSLFRGQHGANRIHNFALELQLCCSRYPDLEFEQDMIKRYSKTNYELCVLLLLLFRSVLTLCALWSCCETLHWSWRFGSHYNKQHVSVVRSEVSWRWVSRCLRFRDDECQVSWGFMTMSVKLAEVSWRWVSR